MRNAIITRMRTRFAEPRYLPLAVAKCIGTATQNHHGSELFLIAYSTGERERRQTPRSLVCARGSPCRRYVQCCTTIIYHPAVFDIKPLTTCDHSATSFANTNIRSSR